jgi:hypothetical protein
MGRTPVLFEYFLESKLYFNKLVFGDCDSFTVELLWHDVISDVIQNICQRQQILARNPHNTCYYQSILTSQHHMLWLIGGSVLDALWVRFDQKSHIILMVMRNQSRYCIKQNSLKLTQQKSNPGAIDGYCLIKKNSIYFNSLLEIHLPMRDTATMIIQSEKTWYSFM